MKRGTKARPDLRVVNDTERPDQQSTERFPIPIVDVSEIKIPNFVYGRAREIWEEFAPDRAKYGYLLPEDSQLFGQLCVRLAAFEINPDSFKSADLAEVRKRLEVYGMAGPQSRVRFTTSDTKKDKASKYLSG